MNDEERRLFQRRLRESSDLLTDAYIELRRQGLSQEDLLVKSIANFLDKVFDKNAEMDYRTIAETAVEIEHSERKAQS